MSATKSEHASAPARGSFADRRWSPLAPSCERDEAQRIAHRFGMTENHLKVSLHRLRESFGEVRRRELAATVQTEAEEELAFIRAAIG